MTFKLDINQIIKNEHVYLNDSRLDDIYKIERAINDVYVSNGWKVIQKGRVIALRGTDEGRLSSAFTSALYLGKYDDMTNTSRFLTSMVRAGHSYEPIRGESVKFLFIGVSKPCYDHLITYTIRNQRVAGGLRANEPWGFVVPYEAKNKVLYAEIMKVQIERVLDEVRKQEGQPAEQLQALRSLYPTGVILPPFVFDFSEEALIKNVFTQRVYEKGTQGETAHVVSEMLEAVRELDPEKWVFLEEYHGQHVVGHNRAMMTLRQRRPKFKDLLAQNGESLTLEEVAGLDVYDLLMSTVGKLPKSMWEK